MTDKFVRHKTYKHSNNTDVVFLVRDIDNTEEGTLLRGLWMRISAMNTLHEICADSITIRNKDVDNWNLYKKEETHE
jgi:hypothetical protein